MRETGPQVASGSTLVALWGKGMRVSQDHAEMQRLVPRQAGDLAPRSLESVLDAVDWPRILRDLEGAQQLDSEFCLLVAEAEVCFVRPFLTQDRYRRPSVGVLALSAQIDWHSSELEAKVAAAWTLGKRLAVAYSQALHGGEDAVVAQLREDRFLGD